MQRACPARLLRVLIPWGGEDGRALPLSSSERTYRNIRVTAHAPSQGHLLVVCTRFGYYTPFSSAQAIRGIKGKRS